MLARPARGLCSLPRWLTARQGLASGCLAQLDISRLFLADPGAQPIAGAMLLPFPHFQLWPTDNSRPLKFTGVTCGWCRASQAIPSLPPFSFLGLKASLVSWVGAVTGPGLQAASCRAGTGLEPDHKAHPPCSKAPSTCPSSSSSPAALSSSRHHPAPKCCCSHAHESSGWGLRDPLSHSC